VLNLLLNAIEASPSGARVTLSLTATRDVVELAVADQGAGIPAERLDAIFQPFFTTKESGTGLGLAIAANIIEQHGGLLTSAHNPDKGMTFRIDLPLERPLKPGEMSVLQ
jgi:signal transduction histidine kinase